MTRLAQAWDRDNAVMVDVISVYGGRWLVENQWTQDRYEAKYTSLHALWIDNDAVEGFDSVAAAFDPQFAYNMVLLLTRNADWAERMTHQWCELYV